MTQHSSAEIIDLGLSRATAAGEGAGAFLATARCAAGLDVRAVSDATKIKADHIEAIEAGDSSRLPATPYAVGFVRVYARYLGLDADGIASEFRKEIEAARPAPAQASQRASIPAYEAGDGVKFASLVGIVAVAVFAVWVVIQISGNPENQTARATDDSPTITVSEQRAEPPRPRPMPANDYPVLPIPAPFSGAAGLDKPAGLESAAAEGAGEDPAQDPAPAARPAAIPQAAPEPVVPEPAAQEPAAPQESVTLAPLQPVVAPEPEPVIEVPPVRESVPARPAAPAPTITEARLVRSIGPDYPDRCSRGAGALETVSVIFDVTAAGRTANARVTASTNDCFESAAISTIGKWRFDPRTVNGAARPQTGVEATLNFRR